MAQLLLKTHNWLDSRLKFPNLTAGQIGLQVGIGPARPCQSDWLKMQQKVGRFGMVVAIDRDEARLERARQFAEKWQLNVLFVRQMPCEGEARFEGLDQSLARARVNLEKVSQVSFLPTAENFWLLEQARQLLVQMEDASISLPLPLSSESDWHAAQAVVALLVEHGFTVKLRRKWSFLWWNLNQLWHLRESHVRGGQCLLLACKGAHQIRWFQSYS